MLKLKHKLEFLDREDGAVDGKCGKPTFGFPLGDFWTRLLTRVRFRWMYYFRGWTAFARTPADIPLPLSRPNFINGNRL